MVVLIVVLAVSLILALCFAADLPPLAVMGERTGDLLVLGWGSPRGARQRRTTCRPGRLRTLSSTCR